MKLRPAIYIAGPHTNGNVMDNIRRAVEIGSALADIGFAPLVPHVATGFWNFAMPRPKWSWMEIDKAWVAKADAVFRMSGASDGADEEEGVAYQHGVPIFYSITEAAAWKVDVFDAKA